MKKSLIGIGFAFLLISLSGCQKTPEEDLVKNKKEQDLEREVKTSREGKNMSAQTPEILATFPDHYQDELTLDGVIVYMDADIHIPKVKRIVSQKVEPGVMKLDKIKDIIRYFTGENVCYPLGVAGSKSELMNIIISIKQEIAALENGSNLTINEGDGTLEEQLTALKEQLKKHEELYAAEEEDQPVTIDEVSFDKNGSIELQSNLGRAEAARLLFYDDPDRGTRIEFMNYSPAYNATADDVSLTLSETEANNIAVRLIEELGIGDLEVMDVEKKSQVVDGEIVGFYDISYKRGLNGLKNLYFEEAASVQTELNETGEEYSAHMGQTKENIQVDDTGVIGINITMPPKVIECINDSVAIYGFEQMKKYLASHLANKSWKATEEMTYLRITNIYLSAMYVVNKSNNQEYFTIPVWDFCGYSYPENIPENSLYNLEKVDEESTYKKTYLTLSAIDGSIISRKTGY